MPWIDADDGWAKAPKLGRRPTTSASDEPVVVVDGWAEVGGLSITEQQLDLREADVVDIGDSVLDRCTILTGAQTDLRIRASELTDCDLSGCRVQALSRTRLVGCKLAGTDLTGACSDVVLERCRMTFGGFRQARIERVAFVDSTLEDVDFFDATLNDVGFEGCTLRKLNLDRAQYERVDLRLATELELENFSNLTGCLVTALQAQSIALQLAHAVGLGLEREDG